MMRSVRTMLLVVVLFYLKLQQTKKCYFVGVVCLLLLLTLLFPQPLAAVAPFVGESQLVSFHDVPVRRDINK